MKELRENSIVSGVSKNQIPKEIFRIIFEELTNGSFSDCYSIILGLSLSLWSKCATKDTGGLILISDKIHLKFYFR